jgi:tRNA threonylcarbamoyladenosine biosynthesis protein TsaB
MAFILNIETATSLCSVALSRDGKVIAQRETLEDKSHAGKLTGFIEELLLETKSKVTDLDAIAVGKGPGSYTGLRIGVSTAKGLCYGSHLPLVAVDTLSIMTSCVIHSQSPVFKALPKPVLFCPMIDARRMEVFTGLFNIHGAATEPVSAKIVDQDTFKDLLEKNHVLFFGSGMNKCAEVLKHPHAIFVQDVHPHASSLALLAEERYSQKLFENIAYFEPFYLKDFIATKSKKGLHV